MTEKSFPVIDISFTNENENLHAGDEKIQKLCDEIMKAFGEWGFIYLKGHGISNDFVKEIFDTSEKFFTLPTEEKEATLMDSNDADNINGYLPYKMETLDFSKPYDLKEAFDFMATMSEEMKSNTPTNFVRCLEEMYKKCKRLSMLILSLVNIGLGINEKDFLVNAHEKIGETGGNITVLRSLYYPAVEKQRIEESQSRCGEHSDYGSVTLLFQDGTGGLEVQSPGGEFFHAVPIEGTVVVNAADLLERWTSGRIKSTRHRVVFPPDTLKARQSIAFFCIPDNDVIVKCLDGSDKYEPVGSYDYVDSRYKATMKGGY